MKKSMITGLLGLLLNALLLTACGGTSPSSGCKTDLDCPADNTCVAGSCQPKQHTTCQQDQDCTGGKVCNQGVCEAPCSTDSNCAQGNWCSGGHCLPGCRADSDCSQGTHCDTNVHQCKSTNCATDSDCLAGLHCISGSCQSSCVLDSDCIQGAYCNSGTCTLGCRSDADCSFGKHCNMTSHQCLASGGCTEGTTQCSGNELQTCNNNTWVDTNDCSASGQICVNGQCAGGGCTNGAVQCNGNIIQTCTNQAWVDGADCSNQGKTCSNGQCVGGGCTNGAVQCNGNITQTCTNQAWVDGTDCSNQGKTCSNGQCVGGGCTNGAVQCNGNIIQTCINQAWVDGTDCSTQLKTCSNGQCVGDGCSNGAVQCKGNIIQNCTNNNWVDGTDCSNQGKTCSNGQCISNTACDPMVQDCPTGQRCILDANNLPACVAAGNGSQCYTSNGDDCPVGMMCIDNGSWYDCYSICLTANDQGCPTGITCGTVIGMDPYGACQPECHPLHQDCGYYSPSCTISNDIPSCSGADGTGSTCAAGGADDCPEGKLCAYDGENQACRHLCNVYNNLGCSSGLTCVGLQGVVQWGVCVDMSCTQNSDCRGMVCKGSTCTPCNASGAPACTSGSSCNQQSGLCEFPADQGLTDPCGILYGKCTTGLLCLGYNGYTKYCYTSCVPSADPFCQPDNIEVCVSLNDAQQGYCDFGGTLAVGDSCGSGGDSCVEGALCLTGSSSSDCFQMCHKGGDNRPRCPSGYSCINMNDSTNPGLGYCY